MNLPRLSDEELPALLPCPFDGAPAERGYTNGSWGYYPGKCWVKCTKCEAASRAFVDEAYDRKRGTYSIRAQAEAQAAEWWNRRAAPVPASQGDGERLKLLEGLLEELVVHDNHETEYDGNVLTICPECGEQDGEHLASCAFVRAKAALAAPVTTKEAEG